MADSIFTRILKKELPSWPVYEDDQALAILDITPVSKGHVLIIPKADYANIYDIPEDLFAHLMVIAKRLAPAIKKATGAEGINIIMNNEPAAGQVVTDHAHIHVVPRFATDSFVRWHGKVPYEEGEKEHYVQLITTALKSS
jgi:histidine triad (HIT) family protein